MDKISDFLYDLRDRVTNPLFISFIISWLIYNWKIPTVLLFYKQSDLKWELCKTYVEFIECNLNIWRSFLIPLFYAIGYTFIFPVLRMLILAFLTKIKTISNKWNMNISKDGTISVQRYIELRKKYLVQTELVSKVVNAESVTINKNAELENEISNLKHSNNESNEELQTLSKSINDINRLSEISILNGDWEYKYSTHDGFRVIITDGDIVRVQLVDGSKIKIGRIEYFCVNHIDKRLNFLYNPQNGSSQYAFFLTFDDSLTHLEGHDHTGQLISYTRENISNSN